MWILAAMVFAGSKWLSWWSCAGADIPVWKHVAYLFAWPGMDAAAFLKGNAAATPSWSEWIGATLKLFAGIVLVFVVVRCVPQEYPMLAGWVGMVGLINILHFGSFHLLSCFWRACGLDAKPLMDTPLSSSGLGEFWGRRWNTAFRDLTHRFLFRPLTKRLGASGALAAGFACSGVLHDAVISLPAGGGYGGPTAFFVIQGAAIFFERSTLGRRAGLGHGWRGWAFTMVTLASPAYVLFHPQFVLNVILPFLEAIGAR